MSAVTRRRIHVGSFGPALFVGAVAVASAALLGWLPLLTVPQAAWRVALASLVLLLVAASLDPTRRLYLPIAGIVTALAVGVLVLVERWPDSPSTAAVAVSRATFAGLSLRPPLVASFGMVMSALLVAIAATWFDRERPTLLDVPQRRPRLWATVATAGILGVILAPDLPGYASAVATRQFSPQWDLDNLTYWSYLVNLGKVPLRDFWYPYGDGAALFQLGVRIGPILLWLYDVVLLTLFFMVVVRRWGVTAATVGTSILVMGHLYGMLPALERYLVPATIVLSYAALPRGELTASSRILFWSACGLAFFIEPPELVYAALPVGLIFGVDVWDRWGAGSSMKDWLLRRCWVDFGVVAVEVITFVVVLAYRGQLGGALEFYGRLSDAAAYSAWPTGLPLVQVTGDSRALFVTLCSTVMIALGVYELMRGGASRTEGGALAGLGVVSLMVLQKHFMRPMDAQLLLIPVVSLMVLGFTWPRVPRPADLLVRGIILGAVVAALVAAPAAPAVLRQLVQAPSRLLSSIDFVTRQGGVAAAANAARFAEDRFAGFQAQREIAARLASRPRQAGGARVFSVTDDGALYVLTGETSVWMPNLYDGSPIYRQARLVKWLRDKRPPYAAVNPQHLVWDDFHKAVRVPLVFSEVVFAYVPLEIVNGIHLSRRRASSEPVALQYWSDVLGADLNVGRLASVSSYTDAADCSRACGDLLEVDVPRGGAGYVRVRVDVGDRQFSISFTRVADETKYRLLLDRVWFWDVAKRARLPHTLGPAAPREAHVHVRPVAIDNALLY